MKGCHIALNFPAFHVSNTKTKLAKTTDKTIRADLLDARSRIPPGIKKIGKRKMNGRRIKKLFL